MKMTATQLTVCAFVFLLSSVTFALPTPTLSINFNKIEGGIIKDIAGNEVGSYRGTNPSLVTGRTGKSGDKAMNFLKGEDCVRVEEKNFSGKSIENDAISFSLWVMRPESGLKQTSAFWAESMSPEGDSRGAQAHIPWTDQNVYFDTAGCCELTESRIQGHVDNRIIDDKWHHWVFIKMGDHKEVWADGVKLFEGQNKNKLVPFRALIIGGGLSCQGQYDGIIDDFMVFDSALSPEDVMALYKM